MNKNLNWRYLFYIFIVINIILFAIYINMPIITPIEDSITPIQPRYLYGDVLEFNVIQEIFTNIIQSDTSKCDIVYIIFYPAASNEMFYRNIFDIDSIGVNDVKICSILSPSGINIIAHAPQTDSKTIYYIADLNLKTDLATTLGLPNMGNRIFAFDVQTGRVILNTVTLLDVRSIRRHAMQYIN
jgi:hypothetical protein